CVWTIAPQIVGLFARDPELARLAVLALRIQVVTLFLVEPQMMSVATLQGMGMGAQAMMLILTRELVLVIPFLLFAARFGVVGAFAARPAADVVAFFVTVAYLSKVHARYRVAPGQEVAAKPGRGLVVEADTGST
ncbi:hypothetical protein AMK68_01700, partial [candidate division KD3-62 bacterium DG_56]